MTFCMGLLLRPVVLNEVLRNIARGLYCVAARVILLPADYIPNNVACADMSNDLNYDIYQFDTAVSGFFGSGSS